MRTHAHAECFYKNCCFETAGNSIFAMEQNAFYRQQTESFERRPDLLEILCQGAVIVKKPTLFVSLRRYSFTRLFEDRSAITGFVWKRVSLISHLSIPGSRLRTAISRVNTFKGHIRASKCKNDMYRSKGLSAPHV